MLSEEGCYPEMNCRTTNFWYLHVAWSGVMFFEDEKAP